MTFWNYSSANALKQLKTTPEGLTSSEAEKRLKQYGPNRLNKKKFPKLFTLFLNQIKNPLVLLLLFSATLALFLSDSTDAIIIFIIILLSAILGVVQEKGAFKILEKLLAQVKTESTVIRDGKAKTVDIETVVPGDIVLLKGGDIIPADCLLLTSNHLLIDESTLTGEAYPVEKEVSVLPENTPLNKRFNALFMGTYVISGSATALIVLSGKSTEYGKIFEHLKENTPKTAFEKNIQQFGYLLLKITFVLVMAIFAINIFFHRPFIESLLFALALGVGFTPQLLPAIVTVNLTHGAKRLAKRRVIVKRLDSIENFGSMDILCVDKTGSITEGKIVLNGFYDFDGKQKDKVLLYGAVNSSLQTGFINPLDIAVLNASKTNLTQWKKIDEIPYDFIHKRITVLTSNDQEVLIITKGEVSSILSLCSHVEIDTNQIVDLSTVKPKIEKVFEEKSKQGFRLLGIAYKKTTSSSLKREMEKDLIFLGFLEFMDPLKAGIVETIEQLTHLGIKVKIITGDNRFVATHIAHQIGLSEEHLLTGEEISLLSEVELNKKVKTQVIFAEIEPLQKERIILALRKAGHTVGYLGDGINDISALHNADVSISVENASNVTKEAADFILLNKDLNVLKEGVEEGRRTFGNTLKYIFMATSANFGNMFSMAGSSLFLSFLPLLPKQILLTNLLTDFPEMTIATDNVDKEFLIKPRKMNMKFIRSFMIVFGLISSVYDFITFGIMFLLTDSIAEFRTGWFVESVLSAAIIVLAIRTRRPFLKSRPSKYLAIAIGAIVLITLLLPYTPPGRLFNFQPLPFVFLLCIAAIIICYIITVEVAKKFFFSARDRAGS